jgi:hypothetical protein
VTAPALPASGPAPAATGNAPRRPFARTIAPLGLAAAGAFAALAATLALTHTTATSPPRPAAAPVNPDAPLHGRTLQQARCADWTVAPAAEKAAAVSALTAIVGAPTEYRGVRGTTLTRPQAYQLLDNVCSKPLARNFLLYELYIRAAAFSSLVPQQP